MSRIRVDFAKLVDPLPRPEGPRCPICGDEIVEEATLRFAMLTNMPVRGRGNSSFTVGEPMANMLIRCATIGLTSTVKIGLKWHSM